MNLSGQVFHARLVCAFLFASGAMLRASTITTVSTSATWTTHSADGIYQGFYTTCSDTDPAASSCVSSDPAVSFANGIANASAADGNISAYALGAAGGPAADGRANASASFHQLFTFTPNIGQNTATRVEFNLWYGLNLEGDAAGGYVTFDGLNLAPNGYGSTQEIVLPYTGGAIVVTAQAAAGADGQDGYGNAAGIASAGLELLGMTMLDANGAPVAGTLVDPPEAILVPEPDLAPMLAMLLPALLFAAKKRRA